jgi:hypothetical protein
MLDEKTCVSEFLACPIALRYPIRWIRLCARHFVIRMLALEPLLEYISKDRAVEHFLKQLHYDAARLLIL